MVFLARQIGLSHRILKNFQGGYSHTRFNHNDVPPISSLLVSEARLILTYRDLVKVFSCFSLLVSMCS